MILTVNEAKTQVCPLIRHCVNPANVSTYGHAPIYEHQSCQGPACGIGWRFLETAPEIPIFVSGETDADFSKRQKAELGARKGYCGAFRVPVHE